MLALLPGGAGCGFAPRDGGAGRFDELEALLGWEVLFFAGLLLIGAFADDFGDGFPDVFAGALFVAAGLLPRFWGDVVAPLRPRAPA